MKNWFSETIKSYTKILSQKMCFFLLLLAVASYTQWGEWGACDQNCKGGVQTRTRICSDATGANRGQDCGPDLQETIECENLPACVGKYSSYKYNTQSFDNQK